MTDNNEGSIEKQRTWEEFCQRNHRVIEDVGLPRAAVLTEEHFLDLLRHGFLDEHSDPTRFHVGQLTAEQQKELLCLVDIYFSTIGDYFPVAALDPKHQKWLRKKYGGTEAK